MQDSSERLTPAERTRVWRRRRLWFWPRRDPDWERATVAGQTLTAGAGLMVRRFAFPPGAPGVARGRLVYFSDLHWTDQDPTLGEALVAAINAENPDWVVFGGDLIRHLEHVPAAGRLLAAVKARRVRLAVPGNWERHHAWMSIRRWRRLFDGMGFRLLANETWADPDPAGPVFVGEDDCRCGVAARSPDQTAGAGDRLVVRLVHNPDAVGNTSGQPLGHLVLAGHTHAGQIRVPGFGALFTSSRYWKTFEFGWHRRRSDGTWLYVSAGVGCTGGALARRRVFAPPEIVTLDLAGGRTPGA